MEMHVRWSAQIEQVRTMKPLQALCLFFCFSIYGHVQSKESVVTVDINYFQAERFRQGEAEAQKYIKAGKAKIFIYGGSLFDSPADRQRIALRTKVLKANGIEFESYPGEGCIQDPGREAYARGFQRTMKPNLDVLLGKDWEKKIEKEVDLLIANERRGHVKGSPNR